LRTFGGRRPLWTCQMKSWRHTVPWARRPAQALATRSKIAFGSAEGLSNVAMGARCGVEPHIVAKWRAPFSGEPAGPAGRRSQTRPSTSDQVEDVVVAKLKSTPKNATHWSRAWWPSGRAAKVSDRADLEIFRTQAPRADRFKLSNDALFVEQVYEVVGLYLDPSECAVALSADEKPQVQALVRSHPAFPMMPGMPERSAPETTSGTGPQPCSRH
jgi:hypothetical protein